MKHLVFLYFKLHKNKIKSIALKVIILVIIIKHFFYNNPLHYSKNLTFSVFILKRVLKKYLIYRKNSNVDFLLLKKLLVTKISFNLIHKKLEFIKFKSPSKCLSMLENKLTDII